MLEITITYIGNTILYFQFVIFMICKEYRFLFIALFYQFRLIFQIIIPQMPIICVNKLFNSCSCIFCVCCQFECVPNCTDSKILSPRIRSQSFDTFSSSYYWMQITKEILNVSKMEWNKPNTAILEHQVLIWFQKKIRFFSFINLSVKALFIFMNKCQNKLQ